jgi:hypothetical protein
MRKHGILLAAPLLAALLVGCDYGSGITGSGKVISREESYRDFDKLKISHSFEVTVVRGEGYRIITRFDDNLEKYLDVDRRGSTVRIGIKKNTGIRRATLEAEVTMPLLTGLKLSGASSADISGFESSRDLSADLSGASSLQGDIVSGDLLMQLSGASTASLKGSGGDLKAEASGASTIDLSAFPVGNADVKASGASNVTMKVEGRLDVKASGASNIHYLGEPAMGNIATSGSSNIRRR